MSRTLSRALAVIAAAATIGLTLSACAAPSPTDAAPTDSTPSVSAPWAEYEGLGAVELIDTLEAVPVAERADDFTASVRYDTVILSDGTSDVAIEIPDELFYLSVAPFVSRSHDCFYHSLTTCLGEFGGEQFEVTVTTAGGEVLLHETRTAADNGFLGIWLPRDIEATIEFRSDHGTASASFATGEEDPTCVTTVQLS